MTKKMKAVFEFDIVFVRDPISPKSMDENCQKCKMRGSLCIAMGDYALCGCGLNGYFLVHAVGAKADIQEVAV
jgi:hypothetical protein